MLQVLGRVCGGCGRALSHLGDGDGCAACDVVLCTPCLGGTTRCPSCQRELDETRGSRPLAGAAGVARGRRQLGAIAFTLLGSVGLVHVLGGGRPVLGLVLQVALLGGLLLLTGAGRTWARWLLTGLIGLAALANAAACVDAPSPLWVLSASLSVLYGWCAFVLALSPSIAALGARRG